MARYAQRPFSGEFRTPAKLPAPNDIGWEPHLFMARDASLSLERVSDPVGMPTAKVGLKICRDTRVAERPIQIIGLVIRGKAQGEEYPQDVIPPRHGWYESYAESSYGPGRFYVNL